MEQGRLSGSKRNTMVYQFTSWYVWWFITVLVLIGCVILGTVSYFLLQRTGEELETIETRLADVAEEEKGELQEELDDVLYPDYADYLVEIRSGGELLAHSRGQEDISEAGEAVELPLFEQLSFAEGEGFFYTREIPWRSEGESGVIQIKAELEDETEFLVLLFQILLYAGLASLAAGSFFIYRLTKKSLRPLLAITDAVRQLQTSGDLTKRVPVPDKPEELAGLATVFNRSLDRIETQFEREKSFVANASHELRTPLTAFRGHLRLLRRWGKDNPEVLEQSLEALDHESSRMERMMVQMLTIARNEHTESKQERVDMTAMLEKVLSQFQAGRTDDAVELNSRLEPDVTVMGDEEQLRQVAVILIENALRYTTAGGITVRLAAGRTGAWFSVADTGIGIPKAEQERVFDRFYRVDKARARQSGGTGLGLSIAKELVQNHHGKIELDSEPGTGSVFTVKLPEK